MRTQSKTPNKLPKARENVGDQVVFGYSYSSDWLKEWREFCEPITDRSESKPKDSLNIELKSAHKLSLFSFLGRGLNV